VLQGYLEKIREMAGVKMSAEDILVLFGNIESIYDFNRYGVSKRIVFTDR